MVLVLGTPQRKPNPIAGARRFHADEEEAATGNHANFGAFAHRFAQARFQRFERRRHVHSADGGALAFRHDAHAVFAANTPDGFAPPALKWLMNARIGPFTPVVFAVILFAALGIVLLSRTVFGRHVYAVGNSPRVAHLSGVNVGRVTMK